MKTQLLLVIVLASLAGCTKANDEIAANCLEKVSSPVSKNLTGDIHGVYNAIKRSSEIGECLAEQLKLNEQNSDAMKAQKILDFVSDYIVYKVDETGTRMPAKTLKDKEGDCEDFTALTGAILNAADVEFYLVQQPALDGEKLGHIFAAIRSDKKTGNTCLGESVAIVDGTDQAATVGVYTGSQGRKGGCGLFKP